MRFWSLTRSHLTPVDGRPSLRAFRAAVAVCGAPQVRVVVNALRGRRWLELEVAFHQGVMFRCNFTHRIITLPRSGWFWFTRAGLARRFKPSRLFPSNPVSSLLNRSLLSGGDPRPLAVWERVLLALGF